MQASSRSDPTAGFDNEPACEATRSAAAATPEGGFGTSRPSWGQDQGGGFDQGQGGGFDQGGGGFDQGGGGFDQGGGFDSNS